MLSGLFLLLGAGIATATPALAVDDPTRPDARVTHGPSCRPGGLVVEVTAGTSPYLVRLATTRDAGGEDEATVTPGTTVTLRTGDVAWGETIDGRLEYTARDGSGATHVDELDNYSFTRPTQEDCEAVHDPTSPHPSPPPSSAPAPGPARGATGAEGQDGETPSSPSGPVDRTPSGTPQETEAGAVPSGPSGWSAASADSVAPGDTVTVRATGFLPGERVVVQLRGGTVLATATAAADGSVRTLIRIPERTETGPTTVDLVGDDSAVTTGIDLQIAALSVPAGSDDAATVIPLVAAAAALVATAAGLASVVGRQRADGGRGGSTAQRA